MAQDKDDNQFDDDVIDAADMDMSDVYDDLDADLIDGEILDDDIPPAQQRKRVKKKTSPFTMIVIGVAVIIGGIVMMMTFSGGSEPAPSDPAQVPPAQQAQTTPTQAPIPAPPQQQDLPQAVPAQQPQPTAEQPITPPQTADTGFMNNPEVLQQQHNAVPVPAPSQQLVPTSEAPAPVAQNNVQQEGPLAPLPQPPSDLPTAGLPQADAVLKADAQPITSQPSVPEPQIANAPAPISAPSDVELKLKDAMARIETLEAELKSARTNATMVASPAPPEPSDDVVMLKQQIADLQADLRAVKSKSTDAQQPRTSSVKKQTTKQKTAKPKSKPKSSADDAPYSPPRVTTQWDLRSAQDGQAIVTRKGGGSFTQVRVGDTLDGVGRITNVTQRGGIWVVEGTQGRISQ